MSSWLAKKSDNSLFYERLCTFEDDQGSYNQKNAGGFIKLNALRLRLENLSKGGK